MIKKIILKTAEIINPPLIQFSPIRSGSTLVYNILKEIFSNKMIYKRHSLRMTDIKKRNVIITYRNPLDCLTSSFKRYGLEVNDNNIKDQILELKRNGLDDLLIIFDAENVLKLKYEDFYNDYDFVFDKLEIFFGINIAQEMRQKIEQKFKIDKVIEFTKKYEDFSKYDKSTHLHGNHISNSKGKPNSYVDFFNAEQLLFIQNELHGYIVKFGYEETVYNNK